MKIIVYSYVLGLILEKRILRAFLLNLSVGTFRRFFVQTPFLNSSRENTWICLCFGIDFGKSDLSSIFTESVGGHV